MLVTQVSLYWKGEEKKKKKSEREKKLSEPRRWKSWQQAKHARPTYSRLRRRNLWQFGSFIGGDFDFCIRCALPWEVLLPSSQTCSLFRGKIISDTVWSPVISWNCAWHEVWIVQPPCFNIDSWAVLANGKEIGSFCLRFRPCWN